MSERESTPERPERGENFIPWEQIEPLVRPGMTFSGLRDAVCAAAGLDPSRHHLRVAGMCLKGSPLATGLRAGVVLLSLEQSAELFSKPTHLGQGTVVIA